jgi:hypothetical protein
MWRIGRTSARRRIRSKEQLVLGGRPKVPETEAAAGLVGSSMDRMAGGIFASSEQEGGDGSEIGSIRMGIR